MHLRITFYALNIPSTSMEIQMAKQSRVTLTDEQHDKLMRAARRRGMALAAYLRAAALEAADKQAAFGAQEVG